MSSRTRLAAYGSAALLAAGGLFATASIATAGPEVLRCNGEVATIVAAPGGGFLEGTDQADVIVGSNQDDRILAGDGSDIVCGRGGNDTLFGNNQGDTLYGGEGNDRMEGGNDFGADVISGGAGVDDRGNGGNGADVCSGSTETQFSC